MKIAVLHESTRFIGGGEHVAYVLGRELRAPVYTCGLMKEADLYLPGASTFFCDISNRYRKERSWLNLAIDWLMAKIPKYDFYIISGSAPRLQCMRDLKYLYYCHTPPRKFKNTLWLHMNELKSGRNVLPELNICRSAENRALLFLYGMKTLRLLDYFYVRAYVQPMNTIANSKLVYERYHEYYGSYPRAVIYPPIEFEKYCSERSENFYLTVSRLEDIKRIDMQIEAFRNTDQNLKIVGTGEKENELKKLASKCSNIEFLGQVKHDELIDLYARCKAFIFSAYQEDFGLTPLEALASGKPVIAICDGGVWEYLNSQNSFCFRTVKELREVITGTSIAEYERMRAACIKTAKGFDLKHFIRKIENVIIELYHG